jgi:hypothetical protein
MIGFALVAFRVPFGFELVVFAAELLGAASRDILLRTGALQAHLRVFIFVASDKPLIAILSHVDLVATLDVGKHHGRGLRGSVRSSLVYNSTDVL